ncbi:hypothetical protein [Fodinibius halophilus]|uniref:hypothetical protein n=1 Tax=Fodinibius halophilus TaxID=1736908 RepID=UPI00197AFD7D|nr:hypothetical protein [Fodinibius halophilus]
MKKVLLITVLLLGASSLLWGQQRLVERSFTVSQDQKVQFDLKLGRLSRFHPGIAMRSRLKRS